MREGERWVERLVVGVGGHVEQQKKKKRWILSVWLCVFETTTPLLSF